MKEKLKQLFFNNTLQRWHFNVLLEESEMSRERLYHFLKELQKEKFIIRVKPRGKMPYYLANRDLSKFRLEKQLYGLIQLHELFEHLNTCEGVKTAILFGSFARGDWNNESDIDLFIYGDDNKVEKALFEKKLGKEIQLFTYNDAKKMKKELDPKLIPNIIKGFHITENIEPFEVMIHA